MTKAAPQYFGITSTTTGHFQDRSGREVQRQIYYIQSGPCSTRQKAEDEARAKLDATDATEKRNLVIVPKSELRQYHIKIDDELYQ